MHTILMIHTKCACMEYVLPKLKNGEFSLFLENSLYGTKENYKLALESIKGAWYFTAQEGYSLKKRGYSYFDVSLQNGDIWELISEKEDRISIIVVHTPKRIPVFQKYILKDACKVTFGKHLDNTVCYDFFQLVSGHHGVLEKRKEGIWVEDYSTNGIFSQGERIYGRKKLKSGEKITLFGLHILILEDILCVYGIGDMKVSDELTPWKGQISTKGDKKYKEEMGFFHRSPRQIPVCNKEPIFISLPKIVLKEKRYRKEFGKIVKRYQEHIKTLSEGYPSAAKCCSYGRESVALWNRNREQEDFFFLRLGQGERVFDVEINVEGEKNRIRKLNREKEIFEKLSGVPVGVSLKHHHLWGIVGEKEGAYGVANILLAQILASYCYTDVKVGIIYNEQRRRNRKRWEFAKWFPHIWSGDGKQRYLAGNSEEAAELFYAWSQMLKKKKDIPWFILFLESPELLSWENQKQYLNLSQNGVTTFLLVKNFRDLPNICEHIIENTEEFQGVYHTNEGPERREKMEFDSVDHSCLTNFSKRLATIRVTDSRQEEGLPEQMGFLEMYQACSVQDLKILERWRKNVTGQNMAVPIGKQEDGELCFLDAHEKKDGPHGLLAGTTGSGKSEVLLTYLLSLAINFNPSEVAFVLVDFKGGGMANFLAGLPHVAGYITNLSGNQVERAMLAIKSENKRRQKLFAAYQVNHISEYTYLRQHGQADEAVPHLFLVVDEFAELKSQFPEFLQELIHVAQVGRSLGLHLLLSTQKPNGTVDENIWSNSRFRICFRVQTKEDSMEMLRKADASYLTGSGQGYLQVGAEERFTKFQAAYTGKLYQSERERDAAVLLTKTGQRELLGQSRVKQQEENSQTELGAITEYLNSEELEAEFGRADKLWLPPLSDYIFLENILEEEKNRQSSVSFSTCIGICDVPREQKQIPYEMDFLEKGNYAILGSVQSGKTTLIETVLFGLMRKYTPKELHLYLLDFNSKRLSVFEKAKQVGGMVTMEEEGKTERFFNLLDGILAERRELLKGGNYFAYRQEGKELPAILTVLDDIENFREQTKDVYLDRMCHLIRDGGNYGIYFLITAGSFGIRGIPGHFREGIKECVALALQDKIQYEDALRKSRISLLPERKKGRGLVSLQEEVLELQVALPLEEMEDYRRNQKIRKTVERLWENQNTYLPKKIPNLPDNLCLFELEKNPKFQKLLEIPDMIPIGYDKAEAEPYFISMEELDGYIISGKRKTGKKNLLILLAMIGKRKGIESIIFGKKHSGFGDYSQWTDGFMKDEDEWMTCLSQLEEDRKKERFLLVEDIRDFLERIEARGRKEIDWISNLIMDGRKKGLHWIFAMKPEDYLVLLQFEIFSAIVEQQRGIHLGGQLNEQKIFHFENFSYQEESAGQPSGTGMAADREKPQTGKIILCMEV